MFPQDLGHTVMHVCVGVHVWRSEDILMCMPHLSPFLRQGLLFVVYVSLAGPWSFLGFLSLCLSRGCDYRCVLLYSNL